MGAAYNDGGPEVSRRSDTQGNGTMPEGFHDDRGYTSVALPTESAAAAEVPLCVDLDGTLVKSDTLVDAVLILARQQPGSPLHWPRWVSKGKASFKREVTGRAIIDVEHLPYNQALLEYLREQRALGRRIYLATAADQNFAEQVAAHFGDLFDGVLASDGTLNLAGSNKLRAFQDRFPGGFTYIGNAMPDRSLLAASVQPMAANPHRSLRRALHRDKTVLHREFQDRRPFGKVLLKAIRLHQWAKNVLVFLPVILAHDLTLSTLTASVMAFFSLSFCASATYIINDLLDIEADRRHPRKRARPFASGDLSPFSGIAIVAGFFAISVVLALLVPVVYQHLLGPVGSYAATPDPFAFLAWLALYTVTTLSYSFALKKMVLVDVIILSGLYTVRIFAGSAASGVPVSAWLGAFSIFFFLSLAFVKRFSELELMISNNRTKASGRGYRVSDIEQLRSFGTGSAFAAVVVLTMYISNLDAAHLYSHTSRLWLLAPVLILWISQVWLLASRGELHEDPVVYAITDKRSWLLGAISAAIVWSAL
jgi:4-hydroxybenzoate polyprenyltransferase